MAQMQTPTPEDKQKQECCCFKSFKSRGLVKGIILILLGLIIAIPSFGHLLSQYFYVILGGLFIAWGLFVMFLKK